MQRHLRGDLAAQGRHTQILYDEGVHAAFYGKADDLRRPGHLPIRDKGIQSQMHLDAAHMTIAHGVGQLLWAEILRALSGIKGAAAQIDRVGAVLYRGTQGVHGAGGR